MMPANSTVVIATRTRRTTCQPSLKIGRLLATIDISTTNKGLLIVYVLLLLLSCLSVLYLTSKGRGGGGKHTHRK